MLGYALLGLCLLAALLLLGKAFVSASPHALLTGLRWGLAGILGVLALFFMVTGRFTYGLPLGLAAAAVLRGIPMPSLGGAGGGWGGLGTPGGSGGGRTSEVSTAFLRMVLEHGSGRMTGTVLDGGFAGRDLESLEPEELMRLRREVERADGESLPLLDSYLDRRLGPTWRTDFAEAGPDAGPSGAAPRAGRMSRAEALEVLGLDEAAGPEQVREAHRRLMMQMHPDRGGSGYLAAKINEAKDVLLDGD